MLTERPTLSCLKPQPIYGAGEAYRMSRGSVGSLQPGASFTIVVDRARLRRWHLDLAARLSGRSAPSLVTVEGSDPLPRSVDLLLALERLTHRLSGDRCSDRVNVAEVGALEGRRVLDLSVSGFRASQVLRLLYDGSPDEAALFGALLAGRAPIIEIVDAGSERVLARARPSIDMAGSLHEAYESIVARVEALAVATLAGTPPEPASDLPPVAALGQISAARYAIRTLAFTAARRLYRLCTNAPHWRVGWRFVDQADVLDRQNLDGPAWRTVPDPGSRFLADPFPIVRQGETWLFVEDFDHTTQKGVISAIPFDTSGPAGPPRVVLETPWHLSYPFLIADRGEVWMIPESSGAKTLRLYRASPFPHRWVEEAILLDGVEVSDATILRVESGFWMFAATRDGRGSFSDTLSLFSASSLVGPWKPHPGNPVLIDASAARSAGALVRRNGRLWRPVQDCSSGYGRALGLAEVTCLDETGFRQVVRSKIRPGPAWPGRRVHTLNRAGRLECIDGSAVSYKVAIGRRTA